ncbi:nicotinate-nucleotide--dimethylbenzimidazole phosphoribosyltransferase [Streptomyces sp. NPDC007971]|uniref:nicotinate-nucleotide--dimethylbenzimidazole phosphoribosyltransferase n=1 Tax=Streptomyces sp. NPDC007971 TaxID=3364799 RepID=UPI0036EDF619
MTDTGQVPAEGQPESAGMVEQPGVPAHGAYTYLSEAPAEDEDLLLPGAQGAWGNEVPPPAPEPVVEAVHEPGPHEVNGRDSGSVDLSGVRLPNPAPPSVPPSPILSTPHDPAAAAQSSRRPLHLGPPIPDASASPVRSLADRGPAGAPVRQPMAPPSGPEYLDAQPLRDMAPQSAAPWGAAPAAVAQAATGAPAAQTVGPAAGSFAEPDDAAQVAMARLATQAVAQTPGEAPQDLAQAGVVHGHDGAQPAHGHDGVYAAPVERGPDGAPVRAGQAPGDVQAAAEAGQEEPVVAQAAQDVPAAPAGQVPAEVMEVDAGGTGAADADGAPVAQMSAVPEAGQVPEAAQQADGTAPAPTATEAGHGTETGHGTEAAPVAETPAGAQELPGGMPSAPVQEMPPASVHEMPPAAVHEMPPAPVQGTQGEAVPGQPAQAGQAADAVQVPEAAAVQNEGGLPQSIEGAPVGDAAQFSDAAPLGDAAQEAGAEGADAVTGAAEAPAQDAGAALAAPVAQGADAGVAEVVPPVGGAVPADAEAQGADGVPAPAGAEGTAVVEAHGPAEDMGAVAARAVPHAADAAAVEGVAPAVVETVAPAAGAVAAQSVPAAADPAAAPMPPGATGAVGAVEAAGAVGAQTDLQTPDTVAGAMVAEPGPVAEGTPAVEGTPAAEPAQAPVPEQIADPGQALAAAPAQNAGPAQDAGPEQAGQAVPAEPVVATAAAEPQAETVAGPEQGAVQAPPDGAATPAAGTPAATEVPEPVLLQAQGPQLAAAAFHQAAAVSNEGEAMAVAQEPSHAQEAAAEGVATAPPGRPSEWVQPSEPVHFSEPSGPAAPAGPQIRSTEAEPAVEQGIPGQPVPGAPADPLPPHVLLEPQPEEPLGRFVPVEGSVPTAPHLAPTPPQPIVLPAQEQQEPVVTVPAPREAEPAAAPDAEPAPDVVQHAEDLETRAADQEESTAAVEEVRQSTGPAAPAYDDAEREAVLKVMRERRDIRNGFRNDPIPHEVLLRVLEAAHTAPSVGHSQPWDFVVIRSAETRRAMHELAQRQREAYAKSLPKGRAKQFKELKIEAILDTPVNIVVTADPTRGGRHTLGRHTQPQMAPYSSALAVENLWLAARAEGLGVGWVSFFDEREMVRALGLPEHLEVVAYLCVGYVDEFPDEPELMQAGWSKRRPLSWVVHEETYGRRALPGEEPHDLLAETVAQIRPLDAKALGEAWERQKRMTKPAGALGMLEIISAQLSGLSRQCPPPIPEPAAVAIFAGDHGVHAQGVTPWPQEVTAQMVANFLGGGAVCNAFANQVGAEVCVVDVGVVADLPATPGLLPRKIRGGTSDMTTGAAMTREEAKAAIEVGIETARDLVAAGNKALLTGEMGIANTTASAALISVFTGADPAEVTGRGTGINDETLARKTEVVRRALELHQPDPADPIGVLAAIGGFEHAAMVGLLLGGASLRTPVILDGVSAGAAALVARAIAPEVLAACIAGHRSAEPGHVAALNKLGLRPLVDLDLRLGEGTGALLALPLVQSTARAMHEVATFDSAGVTEK